MKKIILFILLWSVLLPLSFAAAQDYYKFTTPEQQQRFTTLTSQLRCLVCQNQTLAESNAALADDLRNQIYQKVQHGESNQQIIDYLVARYGNYILYSPPIDVYTMALWCGPFLLLIMGLSYLIYYLVRSRRLHTKPL